MLKIRKEQMKVLAEDKRLEFKARLQAHLEEVLPAKGITIPPAELSRQIDEGIARCKHYRLGRECDAARYIEIVCATLGGFTDQPHPKEARTLLYDMRLEPEEKLDRLQQWAQKNTADKPDREGKH